MMNAAADQIFEEWLTTTQRSHKTSMLSAHRRAMINERLEEGFTTQEVVEAIKGLPHSAWHMGRNYAGRPLDDLDDVLCNAGAVRKLRELYLASKPRVRTELVTCGECEGGWRFVTDNLVERCSCQS